MEINFSTAKTDFSKLIGLDFSLLSEVIENLHRSQRETNAELLHLKEKIKTVSALEQRLTKLETIPPAEQVKLTETPKKLTKSLKITKSELKEILKQPASKPKKAKFKIESQPNATNNPKSPFKRAETTKFTLLGTVKESESDLNSLKQDSSRRELPPYLSKESLKADKITEKLQEMVDIRVAELKEDLIDKIPAKETIQSMQSEIYNIYDSLDTKNSKNDRKGLKSERSSFGE